MGCLLSKAQVSSSSSSSSEDEAEKAPEQAQAQPLAMTVTTAPAPELQLEQPPAPLAQPQLQPQAVAQAVAQQPAMQQQQRQVQVCTGKACRKKGSQEVLAALQQLAIEDGSLSVTSCKCLDLCKAGAHRELVVSFLRMQRLTLDVCRAERAAACNSRRQAQAHHEGRRATAVPRDHRAASSARSSATA